MIIITRDCTIMFNGKLWFIVLFRVAYFNKFYSLSTYHETSVLKVTTLKLIWILVKILTIKYIFLAAAFPKRLFKLYVYFSPDFPKLILFLDRCENRQTEAFKVHSLSLPPAEKRTKECSQTVALHDFFVQLLMRSLPMIGLKYLRDGDQRHLIKCIVLLQ